MMYFKHYCSLSMVITNIRSRKINTSLFTDHYHHYPDHHHHHHHHHQHHHHHHHHPNHHGRVQVLPGYTESPCKSGFALFTHVFPLVTITINVTIIAIITTFKILHTSFPWSSSPSPSPSMQLSRLSRSFIQVPLGHHQHHHHHHRNNHDFQECSYKSSLPSLIS